MKAVTWNSWHKADIVEVTSLLLYVDRDQTLSTANFSRQLT
jgi:hypothetical protein